MKKSIYPFIAFFMFVLCPGIIHGQGYEFELSRLAIDKIKHDDVKGANETWRLLINHLKTTTDKAYTQSSRSKAIGFHLREQADWNFRMGSITDAINAVIQFPKEDKVRSSDPYPYKDLLKEACDNAYFIENTEMLSEIKQISTALDYKSHEFYATIYLQILKGEYENVISKLLQKRESSKGYDRGWCCFHLAYLFILLDQPDKSKEYSDQAVKSLYFDKRTMNYTNGMILLKSNNYVSAIEKFNDGLKVPKVFYRGTFNRKFQYYSARAIAYENLKEFDKAKKDYESALTYYPYYEPALAGLAQLEGKISAERKTDKSAPLITITEPIFRGIIIETSTGDIMVKGVAQDPAGIKSVTINGEKAYSQEGGDFWGNVVLKEGPNKVVITATDFSGNIAEKVVEINRAVGSSAAKEIQVKEGKNYALLIGCQNYDDNKIPSLEDPIPDAVKLKLILKNNYNFTDDNLFTLFNPEVGDFKKQFLEIYEVIQPEDKLVIFYAGHGIWNEKEKKGYWMLTDAKLDDPNTWLPNKTVLDMIARVPARHTLLITDACFSGSVFKTRGLDLGKKDETNPTMVQRMNEKISRVAITSGNDTEVPDKSVFMKYLVKALSENKEKYLTAQKMFINHIIESVMTETRTEPRYGTLELAGHVGGDFIFIKK